MNDDDRKRYLESAHAVQSGIAMEIETAGHETAAATPKHLRTGINTAHVDIASLAELLVAKGVISEAELARALADGMEEEKARYEERLSKRFLRRVTLG